MPCLRFCRLTNPKRKDDVKMVGALVYKMLQSLEAETGERPRPRGYTLCEQALARALRACRLRCCKQPAGSHTPLMAFIALSFPCLFCLIHAWQGA